LLTLDVGDLALTLGATNGNRPAAPTAPEIYQRVTSAIYKLLHERGMTWQITPPRGGTLMSDDMAPLLRAAWRRGGLAARGASAVGQCGALPSSPLVAWNPWGRFARRRRWPGAARRTCSRCSSCWGFCWCPPCGQIADSIPFQGLSKPALLATVIAPFRSAAAWQASSTHSSRRQTRLVYSA
jgi:hypothetical protein